MPKDTSLNEIEKFLKNIPEHLHEKISSDIEAFKKYLIKEGSENIRYIRVGDTNPIREEELNIINDDEELPF